MRLAIVVSHPIQYYAPLFRALATRLNLTVFYAHRATDTDQAATGFGVRFEWDIDLFSGYEYHFLTNVASRPTPDHFNGCDTPDVFAELAEGKFDALVVFGWHLKSYIQASIAAKRLKIPVLARSDSHLRMPRPNHISILKRLGYPLFLRLFNGGLYAGRWSYEYWRHYSFPATRLFYSPHCIDGHWFRRNATVEARMQLRADYGIPANDKVVLFAGKLVEGKRPLDLIAALAGLQFRDQHLWLMIAGSGPLKGVIHETAASLYLGLVDLGFCNQTAMPAVYAAADLFVLPSAPSETWGLAANEALACGLPIVLSDKCGAAPDLTDDGIVGRTFRGGDVKSLQASIINILHSPPSRDQLYKRSDRYTPEKAAKGIYEAVVGILSQ